MISTNKVSPDTTTQHGGHMGRTQTFDTTTVVGAARDVFWRLG